MGEEERLFIDSKKGSKRRIWCNTVFRLEPEGSPQLSSRVGDSPKAELAQLEIWRVEGCTVDTAYPRRSCHCTRVPSFSIIGSQ